MIVKIVLVLLLILTVISASWYFYGNYKDAQSTKLVQELEIKNKQLVKDIEAIKLESIGYKEDIQVKEFEKNTMRREIDSNKTAISLLRMKGLESSKKYAEKISNINADTTDIYSRCLRMCESARQLGVEFSCSSNFCNQFSANSSGVTTTTTK